MELTVQSVVEVDLFNGIEIGEFPRAYRRDRVLDDGPLADMLPPDECSYVFGNPSFGGAKFQSLEQRAQVRRGVALGGSGAALDYVTTRSIPSAVNR